jgi:hypothetical protein
VSLAIFKHLLGLVCFVVSNPAYCVILEGNECMGVACDAPHIA